MRKKYDAEEFEQRLKDKSVEVLERYFKRIVPKSFYQKGVSNLVHEWYSKLLLTQKVGVRKTCEKLRPCLERLGQDLERFGIFV